MAVKSYVRLQASALVVTGRARLAGFFVSSTTSGTIQFWDNTVGSGPALITGVVTPAVGWYPFSVDFTTGLYAVIGGTLDVTIVCDN
jgi:hypothetical protein